MKRILLICILLVSANTYLSAQSYGGVVLASKSAFNTQVTNFDSYMAASNITSATKSMDTLMSMIADQVKYTQYYMNNSTNAANPTLMSAAKTKVISKMQIQGTLQTYRKNLVTNKTGIDTELGKFVLIMD